MNKTSVKGFVIACVIMSLSALLATQARSADQDLTYSLSFTDPELDDLLAPIALYPDPLLAQLLPASTYPTEIADADAWLTSGGNLSAIEDQNWNESVKAIARYPDVLRMMADNMDWTANLGDAFLNQPEDVANSVQRLRRQARDMGNLASNDQQEVSVEDGNIEIVPAQPQYIFVPVYDSAMVYMHRPALNGPSFITFGLGLVIGSWLSMDFDWGHHHVIYHGWNRSGWVNRSRPYVHITNVYLNNSRPYVTQTWRHDASHGNPARYLASRPSGPNADKYVRMGEARGSTPIQRRLVEGVFGPREDTHSYSNRGRESRGTVNQQPTPSALGITQHSTILAPSAGERRAIPTPSISQRPTIPSLSISERRIMPAPTVSQRPVTPDLHVGSSGMSQPRPARTTIQPATMPSVAFGGYRGAGEAKALSQRGQASRQSSGETKLSPPPAQVKHDSPPAGRDAHGGK